MGVFAGGSARDGGGFGDDSFGGDESGGALFPTRSRDTFSNVM
jgi:hypothetical protein